ncbi:MAG: hypothetical protein ABFC94_14640 [Syntrophomonas sp.]
MLVVLAPDFYTGIRQVSLAPEEINSAILYGAFELFVLSLFVVVFERLKGRRRLKSIGTRNLQLKGNKIIYIIYMCFSLILYLLVGRYYNVIHFLSISSEMLEDTANIYIVLVRYVVAIGLTIFTLYCFSVNKLKYERSGHKYRVYISIIVAMLYCSFIVGESRGTQLAVGVLICLILISDYPNFKGRIIFGVTIILVLVISSITLYRTGVVSLVSEHTFASYADKLQIYYGGPESIAQSIKILTVEKLNILNLVFDFFRSTFPFNLLLKNLGDTTSQIYNMHLYEGLFNHGQIVFSSSYGYIYAGLLGVPIILCLNVFLVFIANTYFHYANSYEMKYLSGYCMIRLISATLVNTPTILGSVTQYIFTFGLLYYVSKSIKSRPLKSVRRY